MIDSYSFFTRHKNFPNISQAYPSRIPSKIAAAAFISPFAANVEKEPIKAPGTNLRKRLFPAAHIRNVVKNVINSPTA